MQLFSQPTGEGGWGKGSRKSISEEFNDSFPQETWLDHLQESFKESWDRQESSKRIAQQEFLITITWNEFSIQNGLTLIRDQAESDQRSMRNWDAFRIDQFEIEMKLVAMKAITVQWESLILGVKSSSFVWISVWISSLPPNNSALSLCSVSKKNLSFTVSSTSFPCHIFNLGYIYIYIFFGFNQPPNHLTS